jgi:ABC-type nickel/cobalt efflux system permease component RcnA
VLPKAGRGSLLSLGISGGLVPCPEALAVLLISFSINRLLFGLVLLTAFTLGLAAVLIAIGIAMVMAGPAVSKLAKDGPLLRILPVASAAIVTLVGVGILYQSAVIGGLL